MLEGCRKDGHIRKVRENGGGKGKKKVRRKKRNGRGLVYDWEGKKVRYMFTSVVKVAIKEDVTWKYKDKHYTNTKTN